MQRTDWCPVSTESQAARLACGPGVYLQGKAHSALPSLSCDLPVSSLTLVVRGLRPSCCWQKAGTTAALEGSKELAQTSAGGRSGRATAREATQMQPGLRPELLLTGVQQAGAGTKLRICGASPRGDSSMPRLCLMAKNTACGWCWGLVNNGNSFLTVLAPEAHGQGANVVRFWWGPASCSIVVT